jgi:hypothetical protein
MGNGNITSLPEVIAMSAVTLGRCPLSETVSAIVNDRNGVGC